MPKKLKLAAIITTAAVVILIVVSIIMSIIRGNTVTIEILTVPSDATLTINGEPAKQGKMTLDKGVYTLEASREFFGPVTQEINTDNIDTSVPVFLVLDNNTPEAEQYYRDHPEEVALLERAEGQAYSQKQDQILEQYPLIGQLPFYATSYNISYEINDAGEVVFIITLYPPNAVQFGSDLYNQQIEELKASSLLKLGEVMQIDPQSANVSFKIYNE